jgi:hypothetical protein
VFSRFCKLPTILQRLKAFFPAMRLRKNLILRVRCVTLIRAHYAEFLLPGEILYHRDFNAGYGQCLQITLGNPAIRYDVVDVGGRGALTKAATH